MTDIIEATTTRHFAEARELFEEYAESLGVDLCFQSFDEELASLPGTYVPPKGGLFLAKEGSGLLGCVALRPLGEAGLAELKRLYVRPAARGTGLGRRLTERAIARAKEAGYERIRLDSLATMVEAQRLYRELGFHEIGSYTFNPTAGVVYMELHLGRSPDPSS